MRRAIIYFSLTGNTKTFAEKVASACGADIFRVEMVKPLPASFAGQMMIGGMQSTFAMKPKTKGLPQDITSYDEIILGTPVWAGKCASPMNTVLEDRDLCEKITAAFTLSGGGDNDRCEKQLKRKLPNLKRIAALADRKNSMAKNNDAIIKKFVESILNAKR